MKKSILAIAIAFISLLSDLSASPDASMEPLLRAVDLDIGSAQSVVLSDGSTAQVRLLELVEERDSPRDAVRRARVRVEINGARAWLDAGNYNLSFPLIRRTKLYRVDRP